jgi:hypothetical protein
MTARVLRIVNLEKRLTSSTNCWTMVLLAMVTFAQAAFASSAPKITPLFAAPKSTRVEFVTDFVGRDQDLVTSMNFAPEAVDERLKQTQALEQKYSKTAPKSPEAMQLGSELLNMHLRQAMYLENLRGLGLKDKRYPDIDQFIKVSRNKATEIAKALAASFPQSALTRKWELVPLESAMRTGNDSIYADVIAFGKKNPGSPETIRLRALGVALAETKGTRNNYGTLQAALTLELDAHSEAALKLLAAEAIYRKKPSAAIALFQESARAGAGIKRPGGATGPITARASARLVEQALTTKPRSMNPEIVTFLQSMGLPLHLKYYGERCALNNLPANPGAAFKEYDAIAEFSVTTEAEKTKILRQTLDIALAAQNTDLLVDRWQKLAETPERMQSKEMFGKMLNTQDLIWDKFQKKPSAALAEQYVRLHDSFEKASKLYAAETQHKLRTLEILYKGGQYDQVSRRADQLAKDTDVAATKLAALRFSARAKEKLLGIDDKPKFVAKIEFKNSSDTVLAYVAVLKELAPMVNGPEKERAIYQAAYLTNLVKGRDEGKVEIQKAIASLPRSSIAPLAASYALSDAQESRDYAYIESLARSLEKSKVSPSNKKFANLRSIIEVAVFEQAKVLAAENKHIESAEKYVAFQREFPKSKNADIALQQASKNYTSASKIDDSIKQMEKLLDAYPKSPLAKETRWSAAEQSKSIGQLLRAANHYGAFAKEYKKEGMDRKAWLLAAELHKGLGRYSHAIASYEQHLVTTPDKNQKIAAAKEIALMQQKYGSTQEALAAYDRVIKVAGPSNDEAWARYQLVDILLRQGMEREARGEAKKLFGQNVSDKETQTLQFKAKYLIARLDAEALAKTEPMRDANLLGSTQNLIKNYGAIKKELMSPCEVPGHDYCSVGYYEVAKLAEKLAGQLLAIRPPPTLDPAIAEKITSLVKVESERLLDESKAYSAQAESALEQGAPDTETAELIRAFSQRAKGQDSPELPE